MPTQSKYYKIKVTAPLQSVENIKQVLGEAGAGRQGNYDFCSYSYPVAGQFRPLAGANPAIGKVGELEKVEEEVIECICHEDILADVIKVVRSVHPYEEPAIDIMPRYEVE